MELLYGALCVCVIVVALLCIPPQPDQSAAESEQAAQIHGVPFPEHSQDVLVGTLRNSEQLDVCLQCGFYHIPCDQVQDTEHPIRYIAIYQSVTLFGEQAGVRYYGRVSECEILPRHKITQVYSESDALYYVFRVQEWMQLPAVVLPKETAFVSKRTNMFCLLHSAEVPQLWVRSREEFLLYEMLYKASKEESMQDAMDLNGYTIRVDKNNICLQRNNKRLWSCPLAAFAETPYSVMLCLRQRLRL